MRFIACQLNADVLGMHWSTILLVFSSVRLLSWDADSMKNVQREKNSARAVFAAVSEILGI